jgi:hypothetical protein
MPPMDFNPRPEIQSTSNGTPADNYPASGYWMN